MQMCSTHNADQIADALGRSQKAVLVKLAKLQIKSLPMRKWSASEDAVMRSMFIKGAHAADVAAVLERSVFAVRNRIGPLGLRRRKHTCDVGAEFLNKDGLIMRKVRNDGPREGRWRRADLIDWEAVHGPMPDGYVLMVINIHQPRTPDNLQLIKKENVWDTVTGRDMPPEVRELLRLRQQITKAFQKQSAA